MTPLEMFVKCLVAEIPDLACPALMPPPGQLPLQPHAEDMWPVGLPVGVVCIILVSFAMFIRVFTRSYLLKVFNLEDAIMIFATLAFFAFVGFILDASKLGFGKHQWNVTVGDLLKGLPRSYAAQIVYCFAMYTAKLGVLLQIKNIFNSKTKDFMFWACWACIIVFSCIYTANLFIWIFPCIPIRKAWDPFISGHCNTVSKPGLLSGVVNLVTDIALIILPITAVLRLQMSFRKKLAICGVFATGMLAVAFSAVRLHYSIHRLGSGDLTYWLAVVAACAMPEIAALLLCGSFPTFPRFFTYLWSELHPRHSAGYDGSPNNRYVNAVSIKGRKNSDVELLTCSQDRKSTKESVV